MLSDSEIQDLSEDEKDKFRDFHIHITTKRYPDAGFRNTRLYQENLNIIMKTVILELDKHYIPPHYPSGSPYEYYTREDADKCISGFYRCKYKK